MTAIKCRARPVALKAYSLVNEWMAWRMHAVRTRRLAERPVSACLSVGILLVMSENL